MSDPLWIAAGKGTSVGTATIAASTDLLTITAHGLNNGDTVTVDTLTGGAVGVLVADAVYFVRDATTDDFALAVTPYGEPVAFASDGGADVYRWAPQYHPQELRRAQAMWLYPGVSDPFGARSGVRPHSQAPVSVSGTTWTVHDLTAVVYPGLTSVSGPYVVQHPEESGSLDPADGTNDRIDALDLQIQDDDEDASGQRRAHVVYTAGTPAASPSAPAATANSLRLGTILVPSGGTPSPSVSTLAQWTVAAGGVLPVRDTTEGPTAGLYQGAVRYRQDTDTLEAWDGSAWSGIASTAHYDYVDPMASFANPDGWSTYTPAVTGQGSASFSTRTGRWKRIAPITVAFIVYIVVSSNGSGTNDFQVDAPTDIHRSTRQTALVQISSASGSPSTRMGALSSFTGGSGPTWDRIYWQDGTSTGGLTNLQGQDLVSGMIITLQGVYREAA